MTLAFIDFRAQFFRAFYLVFHPHPLPPSLHPPLIFISIISLELQWCHPFFFVPKFCDFFCSIPDFFFSLDLFFPICQKANTCFVAQSKQVDPLINGIFGFFFLSRVYIFFFAFGSLSFIGSLPFFLRQSSCGATLNTAGIASIPLSFFKSEFRFREWQH